MRKNETSSLGTVEQELVQYDPQQRTLAYEMTTLPPTFTQLRNDWVIKEVSPGRCQLEGEAIFTVAEQAEPMRDKLEDKMGMTLEVFAKAFADRMQQAAS